MIYEQTFFDLVDELDIEELKKDFNLDHLLILKDKNRYLNPDTLDVGDHFKLLKKEALLNDNDAFDYLSEKINYPLEKTNESKENYEILYEINELACKYYEDQLSNDKSNFLNNRKLNKYYIKKFRLGYAGEFGDSLYRHLKEKGYSDDLLFMSGLIRKNDKNEIYDTYRMRIIFPIFNVENKIIGFGGRTVENSDAKYINSIETPVFDKSRNMYGMNFAIDSLKNSNKNYLIACEGYMDVIAFFQQGYWNAVASLGTALTKDHVKLMKKYVDTIYLAYDSDQAGTAASSKAINLIESEGMRVKLINLQPWKDPDEFAKNEGKISLRNRIENASENDKWKIQAKNIKKDNDLFATNVIDLITKHIYET